jgi:hypothetical protein
MRNFTQLGFRIQILLPLAECLLGHNLRHAVNIHGMFVRIAFARKPLCSEFVLK